MIRGLPRDSALAQSVNPELANWSQTDELLAELLEVVDHGNRLLHAIHTEQGDPQPEPLRIRRPGAGELEQMAAARGAEVAAEAPRMATSAEMAAFFGGSAHYAPGG